MADPNLTDAIRKALKQEWDWWIRDEGGELPDTYLDALSETAATAVDKYYLESVKRGI